MTEQFPVNRNTLIIYADDDPDDLFLLQETIETVQPSIRMHNCASGREVYQFLESLKTGDPLPGLILLDLNMPGWGGLQTLELIKNNALYQDIPVFIFTNSDHPKHRSSAINMGAVDFITKPYQKAGLIQACNTFAAYALKEIRLKAV
jgi:CheY-like chemotaxis protein